MPISKITIAVPTNRGIRPKTAQCLADLILYSSKLYDLHIVIAEEGYTIAENRNWIGAQAAQNGSDYLFMVDDDMIFTPDTLEQLLKNNKDICGVAFHPRTYKMDKKTLHETHYDRAQGGLQETDAVGTGIILIKMEVLLETKRPWFDFEYFDNGCVKKGEDWYFCHKAREFGFETWFDSTIKVGHLGEYEY